MNKFVNVCKKGLSFAQRGALLLGAGTTAAFAQSSTYDVTGVTGQITAAVVAVLAIGAAVTAGPKIAVKVWKWASRAL